MSSSRIEAIEFGSLGYLHYYTDWQAEAQAQAMAQIVFRTR